MSTPAAAEYHRQTLYPQQLSLQLSAWWWQAAQAASLWPTWVWMSRRMTDGSDDPLGMLALAALAIMLWRIRDEMLHTPHWSWLMLGLVLTLATTAAAGLLPPLLCGVMAMCALTVTLMAVWPPSLARLPVLGLAILALPLLSSLQFYAGYPLRIITAEVSRWLLAAFFTVSREGSTLLVDGRLIMVDAPCSGVQMAWFGYFTACVVALWMRLDNRQFLLRLPLVGVVVLAGNIGRNSVLVALEAANTTVPPWLHQGIGLIALAVVCLLIASLIGQRSGDHLDGALPVCRTLKTSAEHSAARTASFAWLRRVGLICFTLCAFTPMIRHALAPQAQARPTSATAFIEWPQEWQGTPLRPLALSAVEKRFAQDFPGSIARLTDGKRVFIMRHATQPTRMLHPAADCYRGLGYQIQNEQLQTYPDGRLWRCFIASRHGQNLQVCEHIEDMHGRSYTDASAWYWSALLNPSEGPWTAITIAQPAGSTH